MRPGRVRLQNGSGRGVGQIGGRGQNHKSTPCKSSRGPGYGKGEGRGKGKNR